MNPQEPGRRYSAIREFLDSEASGGIILMAVAAFALLTANSPFAEAYFGGLHVEFGGLSLLHWINDGLMAVFFLLVGLEIKREMSQGALRTWKRRILPGVAAAGGMAVPAVIYLLAQRGDPSTMHGWAIPAATDIAFALGALSLLGSRVPVSLRIFLTALAILDDLGAVLIIAVFYSDGLAPWALGGAAGVIAVLILLNRLGVTRLAPYLLLGLALWWLVLQSGVHATLAGVALALTIPQRASPGHPDDRDSPLHRLEHGLKGWVAFVIVPVFGFANAGVSLAGLGLADLMGPVPLGVAAGLFVGKQIGVFAASAVAIHLRWADLPANASWGQLYGVSILCGIGFTMSLFIGLLAFHSAELQDAAKLGVLTGSVLSAVTGMLLLGVVRRQVPPRRSP